MKIFTMEQIIHLRVNISCIKQFYRIWATSLPGSSPTRPSQRGREGSCSSCSEGKPNNTKTIGRMTCHCLERESKLSLCLSLLGSSRRGSWERGWHIPTLQASARANPLPSRIIRCHGNFLDMVLNSNRPDGSLFTVENIPARTSGTIHMDVPKYSGGSLKFIMPYHCVPVPSISIICIHWFKYLI